MSRSDFETLWIQPNLNAQARGQAVQEILASGRALPCRVSAVDGAFVTVTLEVRSDFTLPPLTMPVAMPAWMRIPVQVDDLGVALAASTFLGGVTGQGQETADLRVTYGNLSNLLFVPLGTTSFPASPDPNKAWVNGPNGARVGETGNTLYIEVDKQANTVTVMVPDGAKVLIGGSGVGDSAHAVPSTQDVQTALNALASDLQTWANSNFQAGANSAPKPTVPTVAGSTTVFVKE